MPLSSHTKTIEVPNESYIDFLGKSPYANKITNIFANKDLSISENFQIELDPDSWENQIGANKEEFYTKIRADSKIGLSVMRYLIRNRVQEELC
ncbi:MAG: hypothetical protein AB8G05_00950 [Oligoflexales bacterium]